MVCIVFGLTNVVSAQEHDCNGSEHNSFFLDSSVLASHIYRTVFDFNDLVEDPYEEEFRIQLLLDTMPSDFEKALNLMSYAAHISPAVGGLSCEDIALSYSGSSFTDFHSTHARLNNKEITLLCSEISAFYDALLRKFLGHEDVFVMELYMGPSGKNSLSITNVDYSHTINIVGIPCGDTVQSFMLDVLHGNFYAGVNGHVMETGEYCRLLRLGKHDSIVPVSILFARPQLMSNSVPETLSETFGIETVADYVMIFDSIMGVDQEYAEEFGILNTPTPLISSSGCENMIYEWRNYDRWSRHVTNNCLEVLDDYGYPDMKYMYFINSGYGFNHEPSSEERQWAEGQIQLILNSGGHIGQ